MPPRLLLHASFSGEEEEFLSKGSAGGGMKNGLARQKPSWHHRGATLDIGPSSAYAIIESHSISLKAKTKFGARVASLAPIKKRFFFREAAARLAVYLAS